MTMAVTNARKTLKLFKYKIRFSYNPEKYRLTDTVLCGNKFVAGSFHQGEKNA